MSLNNLFTQFSNAKNHLLFTNHVGTFHCNYITNKRQEKIRILRYKRNYIGHLFSKILAILAKLVGL